MSRKVNILVVDDNEELCQTIADILESRGYRVATAQAGSEALEQAQKVPFKIVLMDIVLPGMNGVEVYRELKRSNPRSKVIMMTGYAVEDLVRQALDEGAYDVVYKPLDIERIMEAIESCVGAR